MTAREQFPGMARIGVVVSNIDARTSLKIECGEALDEIDSLRARVVVAEEALRVAHEDADRLARSVRNASWGYNASRCAWGFFITGEQRATDLEDHAAAVASRPKADPT